MIDFQNGSIIKLREAEDSLASEVSALFIESS